MKLSRRLAQASLSAAQQLLLLDMLRRVAAADGEIRADEVHLIQRLLPGADALTGEPGGLETLWPHKELAVTACIYVAVADGEYRVEEAREISRMAHQLGMSAHQLGELEQRTFAELAARARQARG